MKNYETFSETLREDHHEIHFIGYDFTGDITCKFVNYTTTLRNNYVHNSKISKRSHHA